MESFQDLHCVVYFKYLYVYVRSIAYLFRPCHGVTLDALASAISVHTMLGPCAWVALY
jgi:hypothetical protein